MVRKQERNGENAALDDEIDSLFRLPLAEFASARNELAARLKQSGRRDDADRVKLLVKPSISAWAVNQLYWTHREAFDELIATSKRFRQGPTRLSGKAADMRQSLDARREVLAHLSDLATELLSDAGHNPAPDTMRRITTTLESLSAYALLPDGPTPGRLTNDLDPPNFESLASLMSGAGTREVAEEPARITPLRKSAVASPQQKAAATAAVRRLEEAHRERIAAAKVSLQEAKRSLTEARGQAQSLETAQKKANVDVKEAEKYRREAEQRLARATAVSEDATRHAQSVAAEIEETAKKVEDAKRTVEQATKELESLLREGPAR